MWRDRRVFRFALLVWSFWPVLVPIYLSGLFIREQYGIRVTVLNESASVLHKVALLVKEGGETQQLNDLAPDGRDRVYFLPKSDSHIDLTFSDGRKTTVKTVIGYVEYGYCGRADINVLPTGEVKSVERISVWGCWGSWLDFL